MVISNNNPYNHRRQSHFNRLCKLSSLVPSSVRNLLMTTILGIVMILISLRNYDTMTFVVMDPLRLEMETMGRNTSTVVGEEGSRSTEMTAFYNSVDGGSKHNNDKDNKELGMKQESSV